MILAIEYKVTTKQEFPGQARDDITKKTYASKRHNRQVSFSPKTLQKGSSFPNTYVFIAPVKYAPAGRRAWL